MIHARIARLSSKPPGRRPVEHELVHEVALFASRPKRGALEQPLGAAQLDNDPLCCRLHQRRYSRRARAMTVAIAQVCGAV